MNWPVFWMAWAYMAAGAVMVAVLYAWVRVGDFIEKRWGLRWSLAFAVTSFALVPPTVAGLIV